MADELAEDSSRAARFMIDADQVPAGSELHHRYADSLKSVSVSANGHEISLEFSIPRDVATRQFGPGGHEKYLLDEIMNRTLKMHYERIYCSRFMSGHGIRLDRIRVVIRFLEPSGQEYHDQIHYSLEDRGYPAVEPLGTICPTDLFVPGSTDLWTGETLKNRLQPAPA
jgi:hypothetical protein